MTKEEQDQMVIDNIPLIHKVIKDLHCIYKTEDEYQEYYDWGLEGLISGVKSYDDAVSKPSTYLYICIKNMILRCFQLSEADKRKINKTPKISMNDLISNEDKDTELGEIIADERINIEEEVEKKIQIEAIIKELNSMKNEKDALAIKMYYGLDGYLPKTYEEIGKEFGVTREMIRTRVNRALNKLKERSRFIERKVFMEEKVIIQENTKPNTENTLLGLNNILFEQLNRLNSVKEDTDFEKEIRKSYAMSQLAQQIVANTNACIKAIKLAKTENVDTKQLSFVGINEK